MKYLIPCTLSVLASAGSVMAQTTYQWNGTTNTSWQTSSNWQASPGQPAFNTTTANARLNVNNGANNTLIYTSAEGTTIFPGGGSVRGLVINGGSMEIQGGTFSTVGSTTGDVIGNSAVGSLTVSGGNYLAGVGVVVGFGTGGTGTLTLSGSGAVTLASSGGTGQALTLGNSTSSGTLNLNGGTLTTSSVAVGGTTGSKTVNFNGGTLKFNGTTGGTLMATGANLTANVRNAGAVIDTNGRNTTISHALTHSVIGGDAARDGGLTKEGTGTLTLSGVNTFNGNTTVNTGTLLLADNAQMVFAWIDGSINTLSGNGSLTLNGDFLFDLTGAAAGTYGIVSSTILGSTSFGGSFTVSGWNEAGNVWTSGDGLASFSELTGQLTVTAVPEPSSFALLGGAASLALVIGSRRKRASSRS